MTEHPRYRMWKDRLDEETAHMAGIAARRAERELEREAWYATWRDYKARNSQRVSRAPTPRWWNVPGWVWYLVRLHSPGRPN